MRPGFGFGRAGRSRLRAPLAAAMAVTMLLAYAGSAFAHTPSVSLSCQYGLKVYLTQYATGGSNTVSVWIDDVPVAGSPFSFGASFSNTWAVQPPTAAHTAKVVIYAWDDPTGSKGWSKTYNLSLPACQQPTPTPTVAPTPTPTVAPTPTPTVAPTPTPTVAPTPTPTVAPTPTPTPTPEPEVTPTPTPTGTTVPATGTPAPTSTPRITPPPTDVAGDEGSGPGAGLALVLALLAGASLAVLPAATRRSRR